jgi:conjugative transposon TraK protein
LVEREKKRRKMFKEPQNINTAFRHIKVFTLAVIAGCIVLCSLAFYKSYDMVKTIQGKVYILANSKALEAYASDRKDNVPVEARDHVKTFHQYFFTLDPDEKVIQANVTKALYLADGSAKREYDNLRENGYYSNIIAGNISQEISMDSIEINLDSYPYYFRCHAMQRIIRTTSIVSRLLVTEGYLRNVSRSDNNPHGFLIERWSTIENKDVNTTNR